MGKIALSFLNGSKIITNIQRRIRLERLSYFVKPITINQKLVKLHSFNILVSWIHKK